MFRSSEGFITGIRNNSPDDSIYTNNRYRILNDMVFLSSVAELADKAVTMNEREAQYECTRKGCHGFTRNKRDGDTDFFKLLKVPYVDFNPVPEDETQLFALEKEGMNSSGPSPMYAPSGTESRPLELFEVQPKVSMISTIVFILLLLVTYLAMVRNKKDRENLLTFSPDTYVVKEV